MKYPARFKPSDKGGYAAWFRDIPQANTRGASLEEAQAMAVDSLLAAMEFYFAQRRPLPEPSVPRDGDELVALPATLAVKAALLNAMTHSQTSHADLARAMGVHPGDVARLLKLRHNTRLDTLADAFKALGLELQFTVQKAST